MASTDKTKFTVIIPAETAAAARRTVAFLAGHPLYLTLGQLADNALRAEIARLEREHNGGQPFPDGRAKAGRPVRPLNAGE
jgi:hypothetical protein